METIKRVAKKKNLNPLLALNRSFDDFNYLNKPPKTISFSDLQSYQTNDFLEDIEIIKKISQKNNWETLFIDYSIPESPLKVARVIIPTISDTLRFRHPLRSKKIDVFKNVISSIEYQKKSIQKLINIFEDDLIDEIVPLLPIGLKEKYHPEEIFYILLGLHLALKNEERSFRIAQLLEEHFPSVTNILKENKKDLT